MRDPRARWGPSTALVSSGLVTVVLALAAVLLRRVELMLLAAPFAVHLARAVVNPPVGGRWRLETSGRQLDEGSSMDTVVLLDGPTVVVTAAWQPVALVRTRPLTPTVTAPGESGARIVHEPLRWGRHGTGSAVISAQDPSGAWTTSWTVDPVELQVRPQVSHLVGGSGVQQPVGLNGAHLSDVRGEGTELAEVREYRPGDRLRRITWRISSRTDALHVVDSLTERDTDVLVVVDSQYPAEELGLLPTSSLDLAVRATTAIAQHYLGFGDRVGVHDLGHRLGNLPLGSGPRQARMLMELISRARRQDQLRASGMRRLARVRPGTLAFVCTPLLDEAVAGEIARLRALGAEVVVVDTLPDGLGAAALRGSAPRTVEAELQELQTQAWVIRRLQRDRQLDELRRHGVAVAAWRGPSSLARVLHAMEMVDRAPRMVRR